MQTAQS